MLGTRASYIIHNILYCALLFLLPRRRTGAVHPAVEYIIITRYTAYDRQIYTRCARSMYMQRAAVFI